DAQEVTQDVFWALWRSPERFDTNRGPLITWLMILSRSRALDLLRRIQASNARDVEFVCESHTAQSPSAEQSVLFKELLSQLPREQSGVLRKLFLEGYAMGEVAANEKIPLGTVKGRARFGLRKLRLGISPERRS